MISFMAVRVRTSSREGQAMMCFTEAPATMFSRAVQVTTDSLEVPVRIVSMAGPATMCFTEARVRTSSTAVPVTINFMAVPVRIVFTVVLATTY
jgi:hypothetical protein